MRRLVLCATAVVLLMAGLSLSAAEPFWAQATFVKGLPTMRAGGIGEPLPLRRGAVLHRGDKVSVPEGSQASFLLSGGGVLVVRGGTETVVGESAGETAPALATVARNLSKTLLSREGDNPMLKHLGGLRGSERNLALAPIRTRVRSGGTILQWVAAPGVKRFAVTLMGPADSLFEEKTAETSLAIPAAKLIPGETYYWEVRDAASTDDFSTLGSGSFTVLDARAESKVQALLADLGRSFPNAVAQEDDTPLFLTYQVYRENGLNADALKTLILLERRDPTDGELQRWKKELMRDLGLADGDDLRLLPPA